MSPRIVGVDANKHFVQMVPPTEMVVFVNFECKIGGVESDVKILYPYIAIEPIIHKLSLVKMFSPPKGERQRSVTVDVGDLTSEIAVAVDGPELTVNELVELKAGDYIQIPNLNESDGYLLLNETPVDVCTWATPEAIGDGEFGVRPQTKTRSSAVPLNDVGHSDEAPIKILAKEIAEELRTGFSSLSGRLDEIVGRQDELTDQIAYSEAIDDEREPFADRKPFAYITADDAESFVPLLGSEHPQTLALILSYLESHAAATILGEFHGEMRCDIAERVSSLGRVAPEVLTRLDRSVGQVFEQHLKTEFPRPGGIVRLVEILNVANRSVEKEVIESLEQSDPDFAEEIKKRMFVFEDIVLLDVKAVSLVMAETDPDVLAIALRGVSEQVRDHVYAGCNDELAERVRTKIAETGPVRLSDVERAQMRIVSIIRKIEQRGSIHIARVGEEIV